MATEAQTQIVMAARTLAAVGLVDAFGHVSMRTGESELLITAPIPLREQSPEGLIPLRTDATELPTSAPREAWLHLAIMAASPETHAVVRAQPRAVSRALAARRTIRPLDGQGAILGPTIPVYDDSRLVRDEPTARAVARALGSASAVVLRGNGAITHGGDLGSAVALMWLLDRSAELAIAADAEGPVLPEAEQASWHQRSSELLPRIYDYLRQSHRPSLDGSTSREGAPQ